MGQAAATEKMKITKETKKDTGNRPRSSRHTPLSPQTFSFSNETTRAPPPPQTSGCSFLLLPGIIRRKTSTRGNPSRRCQRVSAFGEVGRGRYPCPPKNPLPRCAPHGVSTVSIHPTRCVVGGVVGGRWTSGPRGRCALSLVFSAAVVEVGRCKGKETG